MNRAVLILPRGKGQGYPCRTGSPCRPSLVLCQTAQKGVGNPLARGPPPDWPRFAVTLPDLTRTHTLLAFGSPPAAPAMRAPSASEDAGKHRQRYGHVGRITEHRRRFRDEMIGADKGPGDIDQANEPVELEWVTRKQRILVEGALEQALALLGGVWKLQRGHRPRGEIGVADDRSRAFHPR
jgi:hypothetical protein